MSTITKNLSVRTGDTAAPKTSYEGDEHTTKDLESLVSDPSQHLKPIKPDARILWGIKLTNSEFSALH